MRILQVLGRMPSRLSALSSFGRPLCTTTYSPTNLNPGTPASTDPLKPSTNLNLKDDKPPNDQPHQFGDETGKNFTDEDWERFRSTCGFDKWDNENLQEFEKQITTSELPGNALDNLQTKAGIKAVSFAFDGPIEALSEYDPLATTKDDLAFDEKMKAMGIDTENMHADASGAEHTPSEQERGEEDVSQYDQDIINTPPPSPTLSPTLPRSKRARQKLLGDNPSKNEKRPDVNMLPKSIEATFKQPRNLSKERYEHRVAAMESQFSALIEEVLSRMPEWQLMDCEVERILLSPNKRNLTIYYTNPMQSDPRASKKLKNWWKDVIAEVKRDISSRLSVRYVPSIFAEQTKAADSTMDDLFNQIALERSK